MKTMATVIALFILAFLGGGAFLGYHFSQRAISWERIDATINDHFPQLPHIDHDTLRAWLLDEQRIPPVLLDARSEEEFVLSHLADSLWVDTGPAAAARLPSEHLQRQVVVISAVGLRGAPVVRDLRERGVDARLLRHGIFAWANAGYTVVDADGPTHGVHRANATWQQLLNDDLRRRP